MQNEREIDPPLGCAQNQETVDMSISNKMEGKNYICALGEESIAEMEVDKQGEENLPQKHVKSFPAFKDHGEFKR